MPLVPWVRRPGSGKGPRHKTRGEATQDVLWKFNIPWVERRKVMKFLDEHNLNAFSLFESNEGLVETLAVRKILLAMDRKTGGCIE